MCGLCNLLGSPLHLTDVLNANGGYYSIQESPEGRDVSEEISWALATIRKISEDGRLEEVISHRLGRSTGVKLETLVLLKLLLKLFGLPQLRSCPSKQDMLTPKLFV